MVVTLVFNKKGGGEDYVLRLGQSKGPSTQLRLAVKLEESSASSIKASVTPVQLKFKG